MSKGDSYRVFLYELKSILIDLGYKEPMEMWYELPNNRLRKIESDGELKMAKIRVKNRFMHLYVEAPKANDANEAWVERDPVPRENESSDENLEEFLHFALDK